MTDSTPSTPRSASEAAMDLYAPPKDTYIPLEETHIYDRPPWGEFAAAEPADDIPQDLDAEMALLGSMMMDGAIIDEVTPIIGTAEAFYTPVHRAIYLALVGMHERGDPMDLLVASDELRRLGKLDEVGGQSYMIQLAESFADPGNAAQYARLVQGKYVRRQLMGLAIKLRAAAGNPLEEPSNVAASYARQIEEATLQGSLAATVQDATVVMPRVYNELSCGGHIKTGLPTLDSEVEGLERAALTIIGGRPSVGKTAFALNLAIHMAIAGETVLFFSVEMSDILLADRIISILSATSSVERRKRMPPEDARDLCLKAVEEIGPGRLYLNDSLSRISDIVSTARVHIRREKVTVVIVDYLQLCAPTKTGETRNLEVAAMTRALKGLASETGAAVVVLSQLARTATNTKPTLGTLRDSGAIEQDADVVWLLWKEEGQFPGDLVVVCVVAKNRNGPTVDIRLQFRMPTMTFGCPQVKAEVEP